MKRLKLAVVRQRYNPYGGAERFVAPDTRFHRDQIDHAFELIFSANRQLKGNGFAA